MKIATPRLGIIEASSGIIGLLQTSNQDFEIIMSPSTEYLKRYHSRGIAIFMNIIYFFNLILLTDHFSNYVTALICSNNQR